MPLSNFAGIIPHEYSQQIIQETEQQSAVLQLANIMPMGTKIAELPVPGSLPQAQWVSDAGGRKFYSNLSLVPQILTAEEVAAVVAIPDAYLEDNTINLWNWVRPKLAEAIAVALDAAVLFGLNKPASFPVGGIFADAYATNVVGGTDAVDGVNRGMSIVEAEGLNVTGHAADLGAKGLFRGVRDGTGGLLLGTEQVGQVTRPTLYGSRITYPSFASLGRGDFITGAWDYLVIGVRQDIRFRIDPSGVILTDTIANSVSGFQDNVTPMKVWARFGMVCINPVTVRKPLGGKPFARATLAGMTGTGNILANHPHGVVGAPLEGEGDDEKPSGRSTTKK
jgi:HK97 family phage major capsid protein